MTYGPVVPPRFYAAGGTLSAEEKHERLTGMQQRQANLAEAKQRDKLKPRLLDEFIATPDRLMKAGHDIEDIVIDSVATLRMLDGHPLSKLLSRKKIIADQYNAGMRYFKDAYEGGLVPSGVCDTTKERVDCQGAPEMTDRILGARTRFEHALKILDYDKAHILSDVVISEMPLSIYADRFRRFPQKRERDAVALVLLCAALDQLDRHYYPPRRSPMNSAHQNDYRPEIQ